MQLIENATEQKLRGAYYTPSNIADFILQWGINERNNPDILEPSCGDGVFLECIANDNLHYNSITAIEYEPEEASKARNINLNNVDVITGDFHRFCLDTELKFDLVVGNPPFIRYQYYKEEQQKLADQIFKRAKLKRSKLTNAWVTFVVGSTLLLRDKGKMGLVIPSELLMVKYALQLRKYLERTFNKINIISFENLVFEDIQQEVVLLLCEKTGSDEHKIEQIELKDAEDLQKLDPHHLKIPTKDIDFHSDKWTYYFLEKKELDFINKIKGLGIPTISTYANVEVGITTGANDYFTVPDKTVSSYNLQEYARPMVGRSVQVNSLCFTKNDWLANSKKGAKSNILIFDSGVKTKSNEGVCAYIAKGEQNNINKGYKTSIRDEWYIIPSIKLSDALFLRRNNMYPKFVLNEAKAYTTDTMHRVFIKDGVNPKAFVASYYNSLSFLFAEINGRNFGGGCLELMPSEVSDILLPYSEDNEVVFNTLDTMLREKRDTDEILDYTDEIILHKGLGLSMEEVRFVRSIWHKIMDRRLNRPRKTSEKKSVVNVNHQQLNLFDIFEEFGVSPIVENCMVKEPAKKSYGNNVSNIDYSKNLLVCLVKKDNEEQFINRSAKIYYTGKKFPASVSLNKLYYFMPYIKGKGVQDLYLVKIVRVGKRKEGQENEDSKDLRLVFEIEFIKQLFEIPQKIHLDIWRTYTDTSIEDVIKQQP